MDRREAVEAFLKYSMEKDRNAPVLREILSEDFRYRSPLAEFNGVDNYLSVPWDSWLQPRAVEITSFLGDDAQACVAYEMESLDPESGRISFTDWFTFEGERICSVRSNFDASQLKENAFRI